MNFRVAPYFQNNTEKNAVRKFAIDVIKITILCRNVETNVDYAEILL